MLISPTWSQPPNDANSKLKSSYKLTNITAPLMKKKKKKLTNHGIQYDYNSPLLNKKF